MTDFSLISSLEKDYTMIKTRRLKNGVILFLNNYKICAVRNIINIYDDLARKHGNVRVKDFHKYSKLF